MTPKLKPCPFCGGKAQFYGGWMVTASCGNDGCFVSPSTQKCVSIDTAAQAWNTRVPEGGTTRKRKKVPDAD